MQGWNAGKGAIGHRWWSGAIGVVLALVFLTGCSPANQGTVFRDQDSGRPALFVALCAGERIEAAAVTIHGAPEGYGILWRVERRSGAPSVDEVILGEVPPGFDEVVALDEWPLSSRRLEFTAELRGGGATEAGKTFHERSLSNSSPERVEDLRAAASENCSEVPFSLPDPLNRSAPLLLVAVVLGALRAHVANPLTPRVGRQSSWRWSFGFAVVGAGLLLLPWEGGTRNDPLRYLGFGAALGLVLMACALAGRSLRRSAAAWDKAVDAWFVPTLACFFVVPATVFLGVVEGGFLRCGEGWTFDCSPSWWDRVVLLVPLAAAWVAAIFVGEGGWWFAERGQAVSSVESARGRTPKKTAVVLALLFVFGSVETFVADGDDDGSQPGLVAAAELCETELVEELLAEGADPDVPGATVETSQDEHPLPVAVSHCATPVIEALLGAGASTELPADRPPLRVAVEFSNGAALDVLLDAGADTGWTSDDGQTLVWTAADSGDAEIVAALIEAGASVDDPDEHSSQTPLFRAAMGGHGEVVARLLDNRVDPDRRGDLTWFHIGLYVLSLDEAERSRAVDRLGPALGLDPDVLRPLVAGEIFEAMTVLDAGSDLSETVGSFPPLYLAAVRGDAAMVEALLGAGADPTIGTEPTGHLPSEAAEVLGNEEVLALLRPSR